MTNFDERPPCEHFQADVRVAAPLRVCTACVAIDSTWVHLRQCLTCGLTSCCDLSPNRHATAHFRETAHPMIRTAQPDEDWSWCYPDDRLYQPGANPNEPAATGNEMISAHPRERGNP